MPEAITHFKILEQMGSGGLGDVYRARDTNLGRTVALKVLPPRITGSELLDELHATAVRLMQLSHPNIAMLFEIGEDEHRKFMVFEFVQGLPLGSLINGRPLQVRRALEFGINLADALADAHGADMIHGDIRPDNIMITPKDRAKFMNFGLARFTAGGAARATSASPYVAPEELSGQPADSRSDIYSLGAVMVEMLTGRQRSRGLVLAGLNAAVPPELEQTIARMLAANVEHRAQSAASVAAELRSVAAVVDQRTEAAEAADAAEPAGRSREKKSTGAMWIVIVLVLLAVAIAFWWMQ